ncbi:MAG: 6-phosphofructokinase, partial [Chloroflexota bacterium]
IPFSDITDAATGRIRVRRIDIGSEHYDVARRYMIRLERSDLTDAEELAALACTAGMEPEAFARQYGPVAASRGSG